MSINVRKEWKWNAETIWNWLENMYMAIVEDPEQETTYRLNKLGV